MDQRTDHQKIFLVVCVIIFNILSIEPARADEFSDFENEAFSQNSNFEKTSGYIDIIPSPFLSFSTRLYDGAFKLDLKIMGNFYLNEVGLSIPL